MTTFLNQERLLLNLLLRVALLLLLGLRTDETLRTASLSLSLSPSLSLSLPLSLSLSLCASSLPTYIPTYLPTYLPTYRPTSLPLSLPPSLPPYLYILYRRCACKSIQSYITQHYMRHMVDGTYFATLDT